jgi:hypothetical protein
MKVLISGFSEIVQGSDDEGERLTDLRNTWRQRVREHNPLAYPIGKEGAEIGSLLSDLLWAGLALGQGAVKCSTCLKGEQCRNIGKSLIQTHPSPVK